MCELFQQQVSFKWQHLMTHKQQYNIFFHDSAVTHKFFKKQIRSPADHRAAPRLTVRTLRLYRTKASQEREVSSASEVLALLALVTWSAEREGARGQWHLYADCRNLYKSVFVSNKWLGFLLKSYFYILEQQKVQLMCKTLHVLWPNSAVQQTSSCLHPLEDQGTSRKCARSVVRAPSCSKRW